ncbi:MAG: hypothetical protein ACJ8HQ_04655 [Chthoniobacterales bacterium]
MSTITEIKRAIVKLPPAKQRKLAHWFDEHMEDAWDRQIEADAKAGRLDNLVAQARADIAAGRTKPLDEVLGDR